MISERIHEVQSTCPESRNPSRQCQCPTQMKWEERLHASLDVA